jgi:hypothetical protein
VIVLSESALSCSGMENNSKKRSWTSQTVCHFQIQVQVVCGLDVHDFELVRLEVQFLILLPTVSANDLLLSCFTSRLLSAAALEVEFVGDNVVDLSVER